MKASFLTRVVAGMAIATPVTIVFATAALALGATTAVAGLVGAGLGAVGGLIAQAAVQGDDIHE